MSVSSLNRVPPAPVVRTCKFAVIESVPIPILPSDWIRIASPLVVLNDNCCELCVAEIVAIPVLVTSKSNLLSELSCASNLTKGASAFIVTNLLGDVVLIPM